MVTHQHEQQQQHNIEKGQLSTGTSPEIRGENASCGDDDSPHFHCRFLPRGSVGLVRVVVARPAGLPSLPRGEVRTVGSGLRRHEPPEGGSPLPEFPTPTSVQGLLDCTVLAVKPNLELQKRALINPAPVSKQVGAAPPAPPLCVVVGCPAVGRLRKLPPPVHDTAPRPSQG